MKKNTLGKTINGFLKNMHNSISYLNGSKIFAGIMIIVLQISSRFFTIRLSKTMESYLKYTFSRQVLIFAIAWMGTRDIYIALIITLLFTFAADCLFNEDCRFCILPDSFKEYHMKLAEESEDNDITQNIPSMPPKSSSTKEGLTTKNNKLEQTKIIKEDDVQKALKTLHDAKIQSTWNSGEDTFYQ